MLMGYQDKEIPRSLDRIAHEIKEVNRSLKRIEGLLSANRTIANGPHWILVTAKREAICSSCAHSIPVADMLHFSDSRKERPENCPCCNAQMGETVEIV